MRERHAARFWWVSLFTVFLLQGFLLWLISAPLLEAIVAAEPARWTLLDLAALGLFVVGFLFESIGDLQLAYRLPKRWGSVVLNAFNFNNEKFEHYLSSLEEDVVPARTITLGVNFTSP